MSDTLQIGPLYGGGLVLGYRCSCTCRHCLYAAGPKRRDGEPDGDAGLDAILDELARCAPHARYHIGGGEPFLDRHRLRRAVSGMERRGLELEYIETNATWAHTRELAEQALAELAQVGLRCVLVSLSPFHAEHIPPRRTQNLIAAAQRVLPGGAFVWIPEFQAELAASDPDRPLDFDELVARRGDAYARALAERYGVVPGGRAGRYLHRHGLRRPTAEVLSAAPCRQRLTSTDHFHVDGQGWYVPGLCAGLTIPLGELPGEISLERRPVLAALWRGGPAALAELAAAHGFQPAATYSSACDLCSHLRAFLFAAPDFDDESGELGPPGFYEHFALEEVWGRCSVSHLLARQR